MLTATGKILRLSEEIALPDSGVWGLQTQLLKK